MGLLRNAWTLLRALTGGRDDELIDRRIEVCKRCPHINLKDDGRVYCNQCGCPQSTIYPVSELHHKLGYKRLSCPIGRWGEGELDIKTANMTLVAKTLEDSGASVPEYMKRAMQPQKQAPMPTHSHRMPNMSQPGVPFRDAVPLEEVRKAFGDEAARIAEEPGVTVTDPTQGGEKSAASVNTSNQNGA